MRIVGSAANFLGDIFYVLGLNQPQANSVVLVEEGFKCKPVPCLFPQILCKLSLLQTRSRPKYKPRGSLCEWGQTVARGNRMIQRNAGQLEDIAEIQSPLMKLGGYYFLSVLYHLSTIKVSVPINS